jgi:DNA invertase Pin-like site-specific DNA recombinase
MHAAVYARVSTFDQEPENQLAELRRYASARGWTLQEYVDRGVSGAKDRRPALDTLLTDARRRRFDVVVVWRLDRLGRNLRHLITLLEELQALGIAFVSLNEGIDATTPAGKLQMHILGAIAEFERAHRRTGQGGAAARPGARHTPRAPSRLGARRTRPDGQPRVRGSGCTVARRLAVDAQALAPGGSAIVHDRRPAFARIGAGCRRPVGWVRKQVFSERSAGRSWWRGLSPPHLGSPYLGPCASCG